MPDKIYRCAIYTRKSSEEGLEQDFNSLHAQREACEAFIKSQKHEGWKLIPTSYDDGGYSGGTMERPGLQALLAEIRASKIDIIVVYKVDRLTRALHDFARMVEDFDKHGVSFVAVTQQFNTTTSMGRLTLNVLLSFAQFEREVTGERIRDKIAASKKKGLWMGGNVPLGYQPKDRTLVIDPTEAETVRMIYERYLELGCVRALKSELDRTGIASKGGTSFSRGALYHLLSNPIYIGEIRHRTERYPGQHEAIIARELWDRVQEHPAKQNVERQPRPRKSESSPLIHKLFDEAGVRLTPSHVKKTSGRRYRYYVSAALTVGLAKDAPNPWRLPAGELEGTITHAVKSILADRSRLSGDLHQAGWSLRDLQMLMETVRDWPNRDDPDPAPLNLVDRVELSETAISVILELKPLAPSMTTAPTQIQRVVPIRLKRRGQEMRVIIEGAGPRVAPVQNSLLKASARAHCWMEQIISGELKSAAAIAAREGIGSRYVERLLSLAFLPPDMIEDIAQGTQPPDMTVEKLSEVAGGMK
jgi:DNA invertase Pin-like site-specific DNA recombinase